MKKYLFLMFVLCFTSTCALAQKMSVADNSVYLILTSSTFQNACDNFAEWKRIKGKETYVATKNIWTDADVLSVINAYESEGDVVKYLQQSRLGRGCMVNFVAVREEGSIVYI